MIRYFNELSENASYISNYCFYCRNKGYDNVHVTFILSHTENKKTKT